MLRLQKVVTSPCGKNDLSFQTKERNMNLKTRIFCCLALLAVVSLSACTTAVADMVVNQGTVCVEGSSSFAFPDFMSSAGATTQAWNLGGTTQTLNSVSVSGVGTAGIPNTITFTDNQGDMSAWTGGR